jgi:hypothetical protein
MSIPHAGNMERSMFRKGWVYRIGGTAALLTVAVGFGEMAISFLPGGSAPAETAIDRFAQLQSDWFMGLRNLGLLNIFMVILGIPTYFALHTANKENRPLGTLAMAISFIGAAVFFGTNRAFSMLELSDQYAQATTDAQRAMIESAGQAMLSVGRSHSPGTFVGFFLAELAGILMSVVMLRGKVFSKTAALTGIIGFTLLMIFEVISSFVPALNEIGMVVAMGGGIFNVMWMILLGRRLIQLARQEE